jgi:TRAP-type C4-dicarboxylate transport system permease small subunit
MFLVPSFLSAFWQFVLQSSVLITTGLVLLCGVALVYSSRPRRLRDVLWLPFVYFYWCLQAFIALYALLLIVLRKPRRWVKTDKKGVIANSQSGWEV